MRNLVENSDGTYDFDFGLYHYQNIPKDYLEDFKLWEEMMQRNLHKHLFGKYPDTLVQNALKVRW